MLILPSVETSTSVTTVASWKVGSVTAVGVPPSNLEVSRVPGVLAVKLNVSAALLAAWPGVTKPEPRDGKDPALNVPSVKDGAVPALKVSAALVGRVPALNPISRTSLVTVVVNDGRVP